MSDKRFKKINKALKAANEAKKQAAEKGKKVAIVTTPLWAATMNAIRFGRKPK